MRAASLRRLRRSAVALVLAVAAAGCGSSHTVGDQARLLAAARSDARAFLDTYVARDGRVVRHDQAGDTVSEGQAYAMLLAVALNDRERFARVWSWTATHLRGNQGLLAYHWAGGKLVDATPAADADTQAAWALQLAGRRFGNAAYTADARALATAVVTHEAGYDAQGNVTLAAGPWAVPAAGPVTVEPGYWTPPASAALAALTNDGRWQAMAASDTAHLAELAATSLPSDWARLGGSARPAPVASPDGETPVQNGPDAMRAALWNSCSAAGRRVVSRWWPLVRPTAHQAPLSRALDGTPMETSRAPLSASQAAAVALAAGHRKEGLALLDRADVLARTYPTYYGSAWAALGRVLLTTDLLARCDSART